MVLNTLKPNKAIMDPIDIEILNHLRDGKPKEFKQILTEVKLSHNTLKHHLDSLEDQNIITKSKQPVKGRGRPRYEKFSWDYLDSFLSSIVKYHLDFLLNKLIKDLD